jgi:hypothetical protein
MVSIEAPINHHISPSEDVPQLTINHGVAEKLDSSNAFEGQTPLKHMRSAPRSLLNLVQVQRSCSRSGLPPALMLSRQGPSQMA